MDAIIQSSLVESCGLLEDRRTADVISVTSRSQLFQNFSIAIDHDMSNCARKS